MAQSDYIYFDGKPVATLNNSTGTIYFLHDDMLGTPQLATDVNQAVAWQATYEPFGTTTSVSGTITQNLRFPGQYVDLESGWNHNGFRNYIPDLGRYAEPDLLAMEGSARYYMPPMGNFTSEDPIAFSGEANSYSYVRNRPTLATDPFGLVEIEPLPADHVHTLADIDPFCGITAGGCNKVDYRPDFVCEKNPTCNKWKARFTVRLVGDIYVASGPFPYKGRSAADRSVRDTASALRHENLHTDDKVNAVRPIFERIENGTFDSQAECENAASAAEVEAGTAWNQASTASQRRRH